MLTNGKYPVMSAEEAVTYVKHGDTLAFSGFSPAGSAKVIPTALAEYARYTHKRGNPFKLRVLTGASSGHCIDGLLASADAIGWRAPYQGETCLRRQINADKVIIELNRNQSPRLREMMDILIMPPPPNRSPIAIFEPCSRIGWPYATVDPKKVIAVVASNEPDHVADFTPPDAVSHEYGAMLPQA